MGKMLTVTWRFVVGISRVIDFRVHIIAIVILLIINPTNEPPSISMRKAAPMQHMGGNNWSMV